MENRKIFVTSLDYTVDPYSLWSNLLKSTVDSRDCYIITICVHGTCFINCSTGQFHRSNAPEGLQNVFKHSINI